MESIFFYQIFFNIKNLVFLFFFFFSNFLFLLKKIFNFHHIYPANGPAMFSRVLKTFCNGTTFEEKNLTTCGDFIALPTDKCYAITFPEYEKFYEEIYFNETMSRIKDSYFVHIWNKMQDFGNKNYKLKADSKSAYAELARRNCPNVFKTIDKYF